MSSRIVRLLACGLVVAGVTNGSHAQSESAWLIPFNTSFSHSDHHWIFWMPTHPVYESIEARTHVDSASPDGMSMQVFFTERAGGKNQVHYFDTERAANAFRNGLGVYRPMQSTVTGNTGAPRDLEIEFHDKDDQQVQLSMSFGKSQPLSALHAGLTNQMGHNRDVLFLLFFREKAATASANRVVIGGKDFSITPANATSEEQLSRTGYRSNAFVVTFPFGRSQYTWKDGVLSNSWRRTFRAAPASGTLVRSAVADGTTIELTTTPTGEITEYRHWNGRHVVRLSFDPALPSVTTARDGQRVRYAASMDDFGVQVRGTAVVRRSNDRIAIEWQHESPEWTRGYRFQSVVQPTPTGYDLEVSRIAQSGVAQ